MKKEQKKQSDEFTILLFNQLDDIGQLRAVVGLLVMAYVRKRRVDSRRCVQDCQCTESASHIPAS